MLEDFLEITKVDFVDHGSLHLSSLESNEDCLRMGIVITNDDFPDAPQDWEINCYGVKEHSVSLGYHYDFQLSDDHVLLWSHTSQSAAISFYGSSVNALAVVGALCERHRQLVGEWIPFHRFLNSEMNLVELISGGFGMLAEGPEPLIMAYQDVMEECGFSTTRRLSNEPAFFGSEERFSEKAEVSVIILDDSYVIAEAFDANPT